MTGRGALFAVAWYCLLAPVGVAQAHQIEVFAAAEGAVISGYAYLSGGARARGARVIILGPDGARLGETVTDGAGQFAFQATVRTDHRIIVDAGEGHRAEWTVKTAELPATLGAIAGGGTVFTAATNAEDEALGVGGISVETLQIVIDRSIARQIRPLREQLDTYEATVRWHDVLGGLGYIFGIAGMAFYFLGRKR